MCGILALFEPSRPAWCSAVAERMIRLVAHRGPDGQGLRAYDTLTGRSVGYATESGVSLGGMGEDGVVSFGPDLVLGHRRLSIIDLSEGGHQPMGSPAGDVWISFNGEIYNYLALREELAGLGHVFASGSDTEVLLAAWVEWGDACLARLHGMFAFVVVDLHRRRLFAARDRFGIKPLYYYQTPTGGLAFASEIKQFTAHPGWKARMDGQTVYEFLHYGIQDHGERSFFQGVSQLRAGHCLVIPLEASWGGRCSVSQWYTCTPAPLDMSEEAGVARFRELFFASIDDHLRSDVPVGSCLSGGMDSSSIVCAIHARLRAANAPLQRTFSAYSEDPRLDERRHIAVVRDAVGSSHYFIEPSPEELLRGLDRVCWHQDEPFGSTSIWAQWCVFQLARQMGVKVMLDGQGADEILAGYHGAFPVRQATLLRQGRLIAALGEAQAVHGVHHQSWGMLCRLIGNELLPHSFANPLRRLIGRAVDRPNFLDFDRLGAIPRHPRMQHSGPQALKSLSQEMITTTSLPMLLHWEDRDSMAHGIEARVPFLDHRLVEFCLGLPDKHKISGACTKRVLRGAMRGILPNPILSRMDKIGFATAEERWMRGPMRDLFVSLVREAVEGSGGVLRASALNRALAIMDGRARFSFFPWRLISFGRWIRTFNVETP